MVSLAWQSGSRHGLMHIGIQWTGSWKSASWPQNARVSLTEAQLSRLHIPRVLAATDSSHRSETSNFVSESLGLDDSYLLCHALVCVEIKCEPVVIFLDNHTRSLLDGLRPHATLRHTCNKLQNPPLLTDVPTRAQQCQVLWERKLSSSAVRTIFAPKPGLPAQG